MSKVVTWKRYVKAVRYAGFRTNPMIFPIAGTAIIAITAALSVLTRNLLPFVAGLALADLIAMGPFVLGKKRMEEVEKSLSEALRQMAAVLRSGGTFEVAVREIALSDYGQLSKEFARMLKEMEGGKSFIAALQSATFRVDSRLLEKVAAIIGDAIRTGGKVADVLDEIAEDVRAYYHTKRERRVRTTMQFFFLLVSSALLGPFLMGVALGISDFMMSLGEGLLGQILTPQELLQRSIQLNHIQFVFTIFILVESALSAFLSASMREGNLTYGVLYTPIYMLLAYLSLMFGRFLVNALVGT